MDEPDSDQDTVRISNKAKEATDVTPELNDRLVVEYNQQRLVQSVRSYQLHDTIDAWDLLGERMNEIWAI